jgi:hypothetical protein
VKIGKLGRTRAWPKKKPPRAKKKKPSKTNGGCPSFAALPGAPMRIPSTLIEGRTARDESGRTSSARKGRKVERQLKDATILLTADRLIAELPNRSMAELQQQWFNVLRKIGSSRGKPEPLVRFRQAIITEWERRFRLALNDPDYFDWPLTAAGPGDGSMRPAGWHEEGMLAYLGYRVGIVQGVSQGIRRQILDAVFMHPLPPVNGPEYCRQWGPPAAAARLERLAKEIARFTQNAKRKRSADMTSAISDWEADLKYLYRQYYVGKFGFGWPSIETEQRLKRGGRGRWA